MVSADFAEMALELPPEERLELARRLVESVVVPASLNEAVAEGIRRIEDVAAGRITPLGEEQYRAPSNEGAVPPGVSKGHSVIRSRLRRDFDWSLGALPTGN